MKIAVIGAGVIGLSSAVCIQQCCPDVEIEIVADKFSPNTTSDGSGGYWEPVMFGDTDVDQVLKWGKTTYDYLMSLAYSPLAGQLGVQHLSGYTFISGPQTEVIFKDLVDGFRYLTATELARVPDAESGYFYTSVTVDVTPYLKWLMKRFKEKGGKTRCFKVTSLSELSGQYDLIVNCCGIGSWDLLGDKQMVPVRGQLWRVHAPWIKHFYIFLAPDGLNASYIIPGSSNAAVGGTKQMGDWRTETDVDNSSTIWNKAQYLLPSLAKATPLHTWVGLRPMRKNIRMEKEEIQDGGRTIKVIHNYGHGGSGVTLHWGCALEVTKMVLELLGRKDVTDINIDHMSMIKSRM